MNPGSYPKYAIVSEFDAPTISLVCQWVPGIGYCYLDRRKKQYDGMAGHKATSIEAFGFVWSETPDGTVQFSRSEAPATATYRDGAPRRWQSLSDSFQWPIIQQMQPGDK